MSWRFNLEYVAISETRSVHKDTDYLAVNMNINGTINTPQISRLGNLNNGLYYTNLYFDLPAFLRPDAADIVFSYLVINHGGGSAADVEARCKEALGAGPLMEWNSDDAEVTSGNINGFPYYTVACMEGTDRTKNDMNLLWVTIKEVFSGLSADKCDGPVVLDRFSLKASSLSHIAALHIFSYAGLDSAVGCGKNSKYQVYWNVTETAGPPIR